MKADAPQRPVEERGGWEGQQEGGRWEGGSRLGFMGNVTGFDDGERIWGGGGRGVGLAEAGIGGLRKGEYEEGGDRRLGDDGSCKVTVCAAAARVPLEADGVEGEEEEDDDVVMEDGEEGRAVCQSVTVGNDGSAVAGVLELPDRPQVKSMRS